MRFGKMERREVHLHKAQCEMITQTRERAGVTTLVARAGGSRGEKYVASSREIKDRGDSRRYSTMTEEKNRKTRTTSA